MPFVDGLFIGFGLLSVWLAVQGVFWLLRRVREAYDGRDYARELREFQRHHPGEV